MLGAKCKMHNYGIASRCEIFACRQKWYICSADVIYSVFHRMWNDINSLPELISCFFVGNLKPGKPNDRKPGLPRKRNFRHPARDFFSEQAVTAVDILGVFQSRHGAVMRKKIRRRSGISFMRWPQIKRGRGDDLSPRMDSRFAMSDYPNWIAWSLRSGRQNLTALCATAGKHLAAVGGCHSLAETVNLGTMATAGLIGTLHVEYTSCQKHICSTVTDCSRT